MGRRPAYDDPADLTVDLRPTADVAEDYVFGTWDQEYIRKSDPAVRDWEKSTLNSVRLAWEFASKDSETDWLATILNRVEPEGSFPVCGLADGADWDALEKSPVWKRMMEHDGVGEVSERTTLDRIKATTARRLIARGYLNTYLVSLFLAPVGEGELDRLAMFSERLDKIVGVRRHDGSVELQA